MQTSAQKDTWVFDLDNTLYDAQTNLFKQIDQRMQTFIAETLHMDLESAHKLQKEYFNTFGTSLRGLMKNHNVNPDVFLDFVHDIDYSSLPRCEKLRTAIKNLAGRKFIFTNGTKKHANIILKHLRLETEFDAIFDIVDSHYIPKPNIEAYETFIAKFNITPKTSIFVEDMVNNLKAPKTMGFYTVLIETNTIAANERIKANHIDCIHENVLDFLRTVEKNSI